MRLEPALRRLPNGLTAVAVHRPGALAAVVTADVRVGARYESRTDSGLSHFLEHMVFQGCEGYPTSDALNEAAERIGAQIDASTGRDSTHFEHWVDPARQAEALGLLGALLRAPRFHAIESERAIILEEALDEVDERGQVIDAETLSRQDLWADNPLGQTVIGARENLRRFTVDDLRRHHGRHYVAPDIVVTVVSPHPVEASLDQVEAAFDRQPVGPRCEPVTPAPPRGGPRVRFVRDHRSQADVRLVFRTHGQKHPDATALGLVRTALDDGMASRLHRRLGGELGLAYEQWAALERYPDTGAFEIGAQVSPAKVPTFVEAAQKLLADLLRHPPDEDEMARVRFRARWGLTSALESPDAIAALVGTPRLYDAEPPSVAELLARIDRVTRDDLVRVARDVFTREGYVACVVGPLGRSERAAVKRLVMSFEI
jgi:predicted Zn-dependent peptidase